MSFRSSTSSFRLSLILGAVLLVLASWGLDQTSVLPEPYFGGVKLALKFRQLEELDEREGVEVVALGSSLVDTGFDAELFGELTGKTTYNLGVPATDLYLQSLLIQNVVIPLYEPEAILWGIGEAPRVRSEINHQYLHSAAVRHADGPLGSLVFDIERRLPHQRKRRPTQWLRDLSRSQSGDTDAYGHSKKTLTQLERAKRKQELKTVAQEREKRAKTEKRPVRRATRDEFSIGEQEAQALFEETLRMADERGVEILAFFTPYYGGTFGRRSARIEKALTGNIADFQRWILRTLNEHDVPFVNVRYHEEISNNPDFFYDGRHLNLSGAIPTTELLATVFQDRAAIREDWKRIPAHAELEAVFGAYDPENVPRFRAGDTVALARLLQVEDEAVGVVGVYGRFTVATAGRYELRLFDVTLQTREGAYYVRLGDADYQLWAPGADGESSNQVELRAGGMLEPGEHLLEIHSRTKEPITWDRLALVPVD